MENNNAEDKKLVRFDFAAANFETERNIPSNAEIVSSKDFVIWGDGNSYPDYINSLYKNVSVLHSIIEGSVDFACGNKTTIDDPVWETSINAKGETIEDLVRDVYRDYFIYKGFAINVIRNKVGGIAGLYHVPLNRIRTNEDRSLFYYSKDWSRSAGRIKSVKYPAFDPDGKEPSSIYYYADNHDGVYPTPLWAASVSEAEAMVRTSEYWLNAISNGFVGSYVVNFNNGNPTDEQKAELAELFDEKYCGSENAGRAVLLFAEDKDHAAEFMKLETQDFGEKYKSLYEHSQQALFTSFRALPQIFGINLQTGFAEQDYDGAFKLYNRTAIRPVQKIVARAINKITGAAISITPYTLDGEGEKNINEE